MRWRRELSDCGHSWQIASKWGNIWVADTWRRSRPVDASQDGINIVNDAIWCLDVFPGYWATECVQQIASPLVTRSTVLLNPCHEVRPPWMTPCDDRQRDQ